jgi:hypothetical protein
MKRSSRLQPGIPDRLLFSNDLQDFTPFSATLANAHPAAEYNAKATA